jgi:hypothetical protein
MSFGAWNAKATANSCISCISVQYRKLDGSTEALNWQRTVYLYLNEGMGISDIY